LSGIVITFLWWQRKVTLQSHWRKDHKYYRLFGHFPLISLSDIVSINKRSLIPEIFGQCDVKHIMILLIKTIMSVLDISTYNIARFVLTFKTTVIFCMKCWLVSIKQKVSINNHINCLKWNVVIIIIIYGITVVLNVKTNLAILYVEISKTDIIVFIR
jgi:hypothetical protein